MISPWNDTVIGTKAIGPISINFGCICEDVVVPLATFETPLWNSINRGALVSKLCGGINAIIQKELMTRSFIVKCNGGIKEAMSVVQSVSSRKQEISDLVCSTSRYLQFIDVSTEIVGELVFFRLSINSNESSGHNMVTKAAEALINWVTEQYRCEYVSVSGNMCTDKKVSAINGISGRGKHVTAELLISDEICRKYLKTSPNRIHELNTSKNLVGSTLAGSIRSANAHYANMLLALYLATGQDAANIVEGSQGITYTSVTKTNELYFSVNLPNIIVGTVGNGKHLDFVQKNLELMNCTGENASSKLAVIAAATVLCGELSLLAALTNNGELMRAHLSLERGDKRHDRH